uniref:Elongation of very long chain fatty acids protein n=1 Tax=Strigamia maritima TaxID=126957 RepID=T1J205_STRMM
MLRNSALDREMQINFTYVFDFEKNFVIQDRLSWLKNYWQISFIVVIIYLLLIYAGERYMRSREAFVLRKPLIAWNLSLALFSVAGTCRFLPEVIHVWTRYGYQYTVCNPSYFLDNPVIASWVWFFLYSKLVELGDTIFIISRKQKLLFLHSYHHVTVLLYTWYSTQQEISTARWFISMNFTVHSVMYSYYALKAMKVFVPRPIAVTITSAQLLQMLVGLYANLWAYGALMRGENCATNMDNIIKS